MMIKNTFLFLPIVFIPSFYLLGLSPLAESNYFLLVLLLAMFFFSFMAAYAYERIPAKFRKDKSLFYPTLAKISLMMVIDIISYFIFTIFLGMFGVSLTNLCLPQFTDSDQNGGPLPTTIPCQPHEVQTPLWSILPAVFTFSFLIPIIPYIISCLILHPFTKTK